MFLSKRYRRGHVYYLVVKTYREEGAVKQKTLLYLGRLDNLTPTRKRELERKLRRLKDPKSLDQFQKELEKQGYGMAFFSVGQMSVDRVLDLGDVLAQWIIAQQLGIPEIIDKHTTKGGGSLGVGELATIMAINRNSEPCSRLKLPRWYSKTSLPLITGINPEELKENTLLRTLNYLQEERTRRIQKDIYERIKKTYGVKSGRVYYDITSTYFEGTKCPMAKHGYSRDRRSDKLQIVLGIAVDQQGILITHSVFPGNTADISTIEGMSTRLKEEFGIKDMLLIVDQGMISEKKIAFLDKKRYDYLLSLGLKKGVIDKARDREWEVIDKKTNAVVLEFEENERAKRYIVGCNCKLAEDDKDYRESRIRKVAEKLDGIRATVEKGKLKKKTKIAERAGKALKGVKRYFGVEYGEGCFDYKVKGEVVEREELYDGYYVLSTTVGMGVKEAITAYREKDTVEKAIRCIKSFLDIRPSYVWKESHVIGHVFVCMLAYQLRSVMNHVLKKSEVDMSVKEALEYLQRIKVVEIKFTGDRAEVVRKVTNLDERQAMLVEVFDLKENLERVI